MLRATAAGEYGVSEASRLRRQGVQVICIRTFLALWLAGLSAIVIVIMTGPVLGEGSGGIQEAGTISRSDKPVLTSLTVSAGTISPEFSGSHVDYTAPDVPYGTRVLTITAIPESGAEVTYWHYPAGSIAELVDEDTTIEGLQLSLDVGNKVVEVSVTKGSRYRDYRLEITRLNPTVGIRAVGDGPVNEGETLEFEIRRSAATADSLAVRVLTEELEAEVGIGHANVLADDVDGTSRLYYIEGGDATTILRIKTSGDTVWESHSKIRMSIVADDLYTIDTSAGDATVLVQDDEFPASTAVLTVSPNPVGEGAGKTTATVTVTTTGDKKPHGGAFVAVEASDGTAEAGSDYTGVDATIKFTETDFSSVTVDEENRYRASKTVDVTVSQDTDDEIDETFSITASTKSGSPISFEEHDSTVSVTITDDDEVEPAQPTLTSLMVDGGTITPAFSSGILSYTIPDVEYESDRLTIAAGAEAGTSVAFLDSSDSALADLDDITAGQQVALGIGVTVVKIRVTKGDVSQDYSLSITRAKPTVSVRALTTDPGIEGDKIKFEVARSVSAGDALAVKFTLDEIGAGTGVEPGDVLPDSQEEITHSVTIAADKIAATVEIATISDAVWENHSKIQVEIADDDSYTVHGEEDSASVLVRDDEFVAAEAALSVAPNPVGEGAGKTVATVTVTTSGERVPHGLVMIPITTSAGTATVGSDFTTLDASLEFVEGDFSGVEVGGSPRFQASKSVDVEVLQDSLGEEDETFVVALGTPSDTLVTLDADSKSNSVAITDDEPPALTALSVSDGTLTPAFSSTGLSYTVPDVAYGTHLATINVTPGPGVGVSFLDASDNDYEDLDDMTDGHQVHLDIGSTTIKVRVSKGGVEQDYTMVFTRAKPKVSIWAVTTGHATEGATLSFEVSRSAAAGDVLEVRVGMNEVDVVEGEGHGDMLPDDVEGTSPLRTIEVDETSLIFSVDTVADVVWEKHSSVEMLIKPGTRYDIDSEKGTASVVVRDDDFPESTASLSVAPNPVGEGVGKTVATVTVSTDDDRMPHGRVSIPISTSDGTATAGEDFTALDTSLSFSESDFSGVEEDGKTFFQAAKSLEIAILGDSLDEDYETFNVAMGTASQGAVDVGSGGGSVSVTINDGNSSPVVTIATGPNPPEVLGRGTVNLDGTVTDSDNDTLTFAWSASPVDFGTFDSPASEDATWTAPAPLSVEQGVTLTLRVSDDGMPMAVTTADVAVTVRANQAPTVEITTKGGMVKGGEAVMLGAKVTDPEGGELTYQWSGEGSFEDDSAKDTAWTAPAATGVEQIITLTLTVADELGLTDSDNIQVTVPAANADPTFPDTEDGERVLDEGASVGARVEGPVTVMDGDNDTLTFSLGGVDATSFEIDGTGQISVAVGTTLDFEAKREYSVEVSVSDGRDEDGDMDHTVDASLTVRISVGDVEEAGKLTFFSDELRVGEEVRVGVRDPDNYEPSNTEGSVDDADVSSWLWERSESRDGPWAEIIHSTTAIYLPTVEDVDKYLRVTAGYIDRRGPGKSTSGVAGRVGMAGNSPPVISVSPDMATISGCNAITLNATSSDADGDVLSYSWTAYPKVGQFDDAGMESTVWSGPGPGEPATTVELTLTVSDGRGGSAADSVVVTVRGEAVEMGVGE